MAARIERTLTQERRDGEQTVIRQDEILSFPDPVVILGDPGLGKTVLTRWLGEQPGIKFAQAGTFVRTANPSKLFPGTERIVVDGLDEIASAAPGGAVDAVLKQLSAIGNPPFVLSCRAADWQGAADRVKIEDDYGATPVLLRLRPFTEDDARDFLSAEFPMIDPADVLEHIARCGIESLYENPLTLRMLGEVAQDDGPLPETRAHLFDRACRVMLRESNPRHFLVSHARRSEEELLMGAGALCAAQLLCGRIGIFDGPTMETPEGYLHLADVAALPFGEAASDALRVRLFQSEGECRFTHVHRVIAEFLGAMWLVRCHEDGVSETRILSLFRHAEGVPTSLRGLHAWLAHFSSALARRCIKADPYAVLRYGDAESLALDKARTLLSALKALSDDDPFFRAEDWGRHPVSGLIRPELREEILAIIESSDRDEQLRDLLLEAMVGTSLAEGLLPTLESITLDRKRHVEERSGAAKALHVAARRDDWEPVIDCLLGMNDPDSSRIAFELLRRVGLFAVPETTSIRTVLAYFGLSPKHACKGEPFPFRYVSEDIFVDFDATRMASWLDLLVEKARPRMEDAHFQASWHVSRLVRRVAVRILEADPAIQAERVWSWIGWLSAYDGGDPDTDKRLDAVFRKNRALRAAILEHVLLTPCGEGTYFAGRQLSKLASALRPTERDLAGIMNALQERAGDDDIDQDTFHGLLQLGQTADGLPSGLRNAAVECAGGNAELLSMLDRMSESHAKLQAELARQDAVREARRQAVFRAHRSTLTGKSEAVSGGDVHVLSTAAKVYLRWGPGLPSELHFDPEVPPHERLQAVFGDALAELVSAGFIATLHRDDLPTAEDVARTHCAHKFGIAEAPMICGVAETHRLGRPIEDIDPGPLAAAYMALHLGTEPDSSDLDAVGEALEGALFHVDSDWERHFRAAVEPWLDRNGLVPSEVYRLGRETRFARLAGRLSVDWLRRYPTLKFRIQTELMECALDGASEDELRELLVDVGDRVHPDHSTRLLWLSAGYVVDLKDRRKALEDSAREHPDFIWSVRERIAPRDRERFDRISLEHLVFVVRAFGRAWPNVPTPSGVTIIGNRNPSDASEFIRRVIHTIAGDPSPAATYALQALIDGHAPSYMDTSRHALALQRRVRCDHEFSFPGIGELRAVARNGLPESIDDMRAWFADRIEEFRERIRGSDTNMREAYWSDTGEPRSEEFCRDRLIEHVSGPLPESIRFGPEARMPERKRADIAIARNAMKLPVEIKGQWERNVWNAVNDQLVDRYAVDWQAGDCGVYIVLWFGNVPRKNLPKHPDGLPRPKTPDLLEEMLKARLPEALHSSIDIFVIDLSRPAATT